MSTSWADVVDNAPSGPDNYENKPSGVPVKPAYVPPHLRNKPAASQQAVTPAVSNGSLPPMNDRLGHGGQTSGSRWGAPRLDYGRPGYGTGGGRGGGGGGGWGNRGGRDWEANPFGNDEIEAVEETKSEQENNGINFDAYGDIPVETMCSFGPGVICTNVLYSTPEMCKRNLFWVVTKMQVIVDRYPTWSGDVQVDTWVAPNGKNGMRRDWLLRDYKTGEILTRASSNWVMMNKETRRLSKIPDEVG